MENGRIWNKWANKIKRFRIGFLSNSQDEDGPGLTRREKIIVFLFAYVIALILWFLVNLSRPFTLTVNIPVELGQLPPKKALSTPLPSHAIVNFSGEGWKLISLYHNPPPVRIDPVQGDMNFYDIVREQMNAFAGVNVIKVLPAVINIHLEKRVIKKIPVVSNVKVQTKSQFEIIGKPIITPDSVVISGARSVVDTIKSWQTDKISLNDVRGKIDKEINLTPPPGLIRMSASKVRFEANVQEFTEGESKVSIQTTDLPKGQQITYSPTIITVKYNVPIDEYEKSQEIVPFSAYVSYKDVLKDTTGFISPVIKENKNNLHISLRSYEPTKVSYYIILSSEGKAPSKN